MLVAIVRIEVNGMIGVPSLSAHAVRAETEAALDTAIAEYQDFLVGCDQRSNEDLVQKLRAHGEEPLVGRFNVTRANYPVLWRGDAEDVPEQLRVFAR